MTSTRLLLARSLMNRMAKRSRKGFTLIELLVVVVIIGILASVALPSFVGAQDKARNASVQSNCRTIQMALEEYSTEKNGAYPKSGTATDWTDAAAGLVSYLPGKKMPRSPWASGTVVQGAHVLASGAAGVTSNVTAFTSAENSVAAATAAAMTPVNTTVSGSGVIPASGTFTINTYGAISYDDEPNTQYFVLYASGKKGKGAICVANASNAGQ